MSLKASFISIAALCAPLVMSSPAAAQTAVSPAEARAVAKDAYIYAFSMLENYNTMYKQLADPAGREYVGGFGKFRHYSQLYTPENRDVVTPNNDTPYSWAWLDLRAEPWVVSVPAVANKRYYVQQWVDLYTYNFAYLGSRATGNEAGSYMIAGPHWKGKPPPGIKRVFRSETDIVMTLTRTALNGPDDIEAVKAVQAGMRLEPLSSFRKTAAPPAAPAVTFPPYDVAKARSHDFIGYLNFLLQFTQPPNKSEIALMKRFSTIGIGPGKPFDASTVPPETLAAIDAGVKDAQTAMAEKVKVTLSSNGLFGTRADLKNDYMKRAIAAEMGLYGNSLVEAWYGGYVGDGSKPSTIHFAPGQLPPAKFFWSMTLYTLPDRFLYANELKRYSIGDRTPGLKRDADGGLTLHVGHTSPGPDKESNWLPAPDGPYSAVGRIYGPSKEAMNGTWKLPPLVPVAAK
ncbi:DUF1254 domain-containing protein [Variovorax saccharolyticus]|uniref:DUF1254 domain-containing protein n=1 Tax=Variovorax saccharolyticus TaxID=3053516 RepID=UPI002578F87B|nr:DUF1254 domain-containing protein [Variovorax sp. J31P216]MDM0026488.1 DUF1254 domain-containing protein [Variovorax sp. J31P216]